MPACSSSGLQLGHDRPMAKSALTWKTEHEFPIRNKQGYTNDGGMIIWGHDENLFWEKEKAESSRDAHVRK
ncbi:hypothetical protein NC651_009698 [Populus alba x Populus x berolinensis]|nr:hypothetical protein NC651_009698 [Populus alba x Populus x berolinensis]